MLVGAGGNAGNQAAVLVIRPRAGRDPRGVGGRLPPDGDAARGADRAGAHLLRVREGAALWVCALLCVRAEAPLRGGEQERRPRCRYPLYDALAIAASLAAIVAVSIVLGALLPLLLHRASIDPAHAGATIQVSTHTTTRTHTPPHTAHPRALGLALLMRGAPVV